MKTTVILFFLALLSISLNAQKAPIKYGKVSKEELEMKYYDKDSSASAVVLCDYGSLNVETFKFTRVIRIKILTKEGLDWANRTFSGADKTAVRGKTFNLDNGEIVVSKLKQESVFRERVYEDLYRLNISMPNVKVGSVFDIEFSYFSLPAEWNFQQTIPVKRSELVIPKSSYVKYRKKQVGFGRVFAENGTRWYSIDMPAFMPENYTNSIENYITKFELDLLSVSIPGVLYKEYTTDWGHVMGLLVGHSNFGSLINPALYLNEDVKTIEEQYSTKLEQLKAAFELAKTVKWNGVESIFSGEKTLGEAFRDKSGNSTDINLILLNLLRKLDIEAYPVVMSSRSNGILDPYSPSMNKLNYMIVQAYVDGNEYLLDATDKYVPIDLIPPRSLNLFGKAINKKDRKYHSVDVVTEKKNKKSYYYNLSISNDLTISGTANASYYDYAAYNFRHEMENYFSNDEYVTYKESSYEGLEISNFELFELDNLYKPVKEKFEIKLRNQIFEVDGKLYLSPMILHQLKDNPLRQEERLYPVDFVSAQETALIISLQIPEGYEIESVPAPLNIALPEKSAQVLFNISAMNGVVQLSYKLKFNKAVYMSNEYNYLKQLYNEIIKKHAEYVVLKKVDE
jgi:hypothetical protein